MTCVFPLSLFLRHSEDLGQPLDPVSRAGTEGDLSVVRASGGHHGRHHQATGQGDHSKERRGGLPRPGDVPFLGTGGTGGTPDADAPGRLSADGAEETEQHHGRREEQR